MKKKIIILVLLLLSLVCSINGKMWFLNESNIMTIMLSILGVSFTTYCFLFSPIANILNKTDLSNNIECILNEFLNSINENIKFIFLCLAIVLLTNMVYFINIPLLYDSLDINLGLFKMVSLKLFIKNLLYSIFFFLQLYAFYDTMNATFKIFKDCFFNNNNT